MNNNSTITQTNTNVNPPVLPGFFTSFLSSEKQNEPRTPLQNQPAPGDAFIYSLPSRPPQQSQSIQQGFQTHQSTTQQGFGFPGQSIQQGQPIQPVPFGQPNQNGQGGYALGIGITQFADFQNMFAAKQQGFLEKAQDDFTKSMASIARGMTQNYTSNARNRCRMRMQRGTCKRPRVPNDPDRLCVTCRIKNNKACSTGGASYFRYWNPNPNSDDDEPDEVLELKVRGMSREDSPPRNRRHRSRTAPKIVEVDIEPDLSIPSDTKPPASRPPPPNSHPNNPPPTLAAALSPAQQLAISMSKTSLDKQEEDGWELEDYHFIDDDKDAKLKKTNNAQISG